MALIKKKKIKREVSSFNSSTSRWHSNRTLTIDNKYEASSKLSWMSKKRGHITIQISMCFLNICDQINSYSNCPIIHCTYLTYQYMCDSIKNMLTFSQLLYVCIKKYKSSKGTPLYTHIYMNHSHKKLYIIDLTHENIHKFIIGKS
jgi:hypothetical protein